VSRKNSDSSSESILWGKSIGILLSGLKDRGLLSEFLSGMGVIVRAPSFVNHFPFSENDGLDAVICDSFSAARWRKELISRKEKEEIFFPIIVVVTNGRSAKGWIEAGFDEVFVAPVTKNLLIARLSNLIQLREQSRQILEKGELLFRTLVEQSLVGIAIVKGENFYYINNKFAKMIGLSPEAIKNNFTIFDVADSKERDLVREVIDSLYNLSWPYYQGEMKFRDKDGREINCEVLARRIEYRGEAMVFAIILDVTDKKKLEEELRMAQKMTAIGKLAGGIAHDFNNLLTIILGNSELLLSSDKIDEQTLSDIEEIKRAAERGAALTEKLLILSRRKFSKPEIISPNDVLAGMRVMLTRTLGEDIELSLEFDRSLGKVKADPSAIEQIVLNIALNAREAMPEGGTLSIKTMPFEVDESDPKVVSGERSSGKYVVMIFKDTGKGMDKKTLKQIFDPFFSTKGKGKGTGLGLSIVYSLVEQMGGWIEVYSEPGSGATFRIFIPQTEEEYVRDVVISEGKVEDGELVGRGERILLVEDEEMVRRYTANVLRQNGYEVVEAARSKEALEIFKRDKGNFDVILSDVVLPDFNGLELVNELEKISPNLKVVFISGYSDERSRWELIVRRGYKFLQKPFYLKELLRAIKVLIVRESV